MFSNCCNSPCDYDHTLDLWICRKCHKVCMEFNEGSEDDNSTVDWMDGDKNEPDPENR